MIITTQEFYESNAKSLIDRYESADMSILHHKLIMSIPADSKIIDIGFGSGRDLAFMQSKGYDIYGIDPVEVFVDQAKNRFIDIAEHFRIGSFLSTDFPSDWVNTFDAVISIAVWMHLIVDEYIDAIETIKSLLKPNGTVVLSFSLGGRESNDGRHFELLKLQDIINEFVKYGFTLVDSECTHDSLGRDSIQWATVVFKYD